MRAAVIRSLPTAAPVPGEHPRPSLEADDDTIVAVEACGICGTDLHILDGHSYAPALPFVLGHEPVGVVIEAGKDAQGWLGRRVTMTLFNGCGACAECKRGDERVCQCMRWVTGILSSDGGFAEYVRISATQLVEVPAALDPTSAAVLVDAGATAFNSRRVALANTEAPLVVIGGGPVGWVLAEQLRVDGRLLAVVEPSPRRLAALVEAGIPAVAGLAEIDAPIHAIADCSGSPTVPSEALARLEPHGLFLVVGYATSTLDFALIARKELTLKGIRSGSRIDLLEALTAAAAGSIRLPEIATWPLDDIESAFAALRSQSVPGKAIITVGSETR